MADIEIDITSAQQEQPDIDVHPIYGPKGANGANGRAATIEVGTVRTGAAGTTAIITNSGDSSNAVFNFTIPKGDTGETGVSVTGVTLLSTVGLDKTYRMTFSDNTYFDYVVSNGASGSTQWGGIWGTLSNQTDLMTSLNGKADIDLANLSSTGEAHFANPDLQNLSTLGNARLQYAPFAINDGYVFNSENDTLTYSENIIRCYSCTITTADGRTKVFDTATTLDVSGQADGSYSIFKDYETGELSLADGLIVSKTEYPIYHSTSIIPKMTSATTPKGSVTTTGSNWYNGGWACWGDDPDNPTLNVGQPVGASGTSTTTYTLEKSVSGKGKFSFYQGSNSPASYCAFYLLTAISEHNTQYNFYRANNLTSGLRHDVELNINEKIKAFRCTVTMAGSNEQAGTGYAAFRYYEAVNAYWLDTSTTPANLKVNGVINNNLVYIGDCTIEDGGVTALKNRYFNDSGYLIEKSVLSAVMPDYSAGISVSGNSFTASADGVWYVLAYNTSAFQSYIVVNGTTTSCGISGTSGYQDQSALAIYLSKGDVVSWSTNPSYIIMSVFYPLKGAN